MCFADRTFAPHGGFEQNRLFRLPVATQWQTVRGTSAGAKGYILQPRLATQSILW